MDIWQIVVIVVLAALILVWVAVIAYNKGRVSGRLAAEQDLSGDEDTHSLFGDDAPVRPTERRLIEVLPEALIVTDRNGLVQYSSPGSVPFGLVSGDRLNSREVEDILTQAAADGGMREREVQLPVNRNSYPSSNGRGLEAGQSRPSNTLYLRVRIGDIGDDLYAIFINDMSEQRRFEAVRRDFVTNVSHELKTPAGAIALLAETVTDAADDPDAVRYFSGRISKESARLTELVHHLIDLQKAQSPQSVIDARRISALDVARAAIAANQTQADSRHVDIRLSVNGQSVPTKVEEPADGEGSLEESGSPATNGPMIKADKEAMQTAVKNLVENAIHYSRTHHCGGRRGGARWQSHHSRGRSGHRHPRQIAGPHFRAILPGRPGPFARDRRFGTRLGHHQALRAGERRSDFGLVAYGGGVDVHHRAAGRPG